MSDMRRREVITLLGGAAAAWPLAARAQQAGRTYRLGVLHNQGPQSPPFPSFYDELRRLGFVEGQNLIVDSRGYAVRTEHFPAVAAELVKAQVDAILAGGAAAARAAQAATRTIPILSLTDDMVGQGLVASLARPGGNIHQHSRHRTRRQTPGNPHGDGTRRPPHGGACRCQYRSAPEHADATGGSGRARRGACRPFGRAA